MRLKRCCAWALLPLIVGCGGSGSSITPDPGPDLGERSVLQTATLRGLRLQQQNNGDVQFGLTKKPAVIVDWQHVILDPIRSFWVKSTLAQTSDEGPDGVSTTFRSRYTNNFFVDEALTTSAGTRVDYSEQIEFTQTETQDVTETLTQGPLAGYTYHLDSSTNLSTMEATVEATATHPSWGEMKSVGFAGWYTITIKKDGKEDKYETSVDGPLTATLSGGQKLAIADGEGTVKNSAGKQIATFVVTDGQAKITWENGDVTTVSVW